MARDDLDPDRFAAHRARVRGVDLEYLHEGAPVVGGPARVPLLLVHGWPETRRIWWRVAGPLVAAGFEVVAPDLRGFGGSGPGDDGLGDVVAHALDLTALLRRLGLGPVVVVGGDLGGPVGIELALREPDLVDRMVLFDAPLPPMSDELTTRSDGTPLRAVPPLEAMDYFLRQGRDADGLAAELADDAARDAYLATFYGSRGWAAPGAFDAAATAFHTTPLADAATFRATLRTYESVFDRSQRTDRPRFAEAAGTDLRLLVLHGLADGVVAPDFGELAVRAFPRADGPVLLDGVGHFVPWEAPEELVGRTVAFCADLLG
mgnify:CR=1 FL=1